jgi:hypothetical protein
MTSDELIEVEVIGKAQSGLESWDNMKMKS